MTLHSCLICNFRPHTVTPSHVEFYVSMYGPAPIYVKKTNTVRSREGCEACRRKRRKVKLFVTWTSWGAEKLEPAQCDEGKPGCKSCLRLQVECRYVSKTVEFRNVSRWAAQKVNQVRSGRMNSVPIENGWLSTDRQAATQHRVEPLS